MIASPTKIEDMKIRQMMLECMESCLALGFNEHAKDIGESSRKIKARIDTHDYTQEDKNRFLWITKPQSKLS